MKLPAILTRDHHSKKFFLLLQLFLITACLLTVSAIIMQKFIFQKKAAPYAASLDLPASLNATMGSDINIPIFLSTKGASIVGVDIVLSFDRGRLTLTDILTNAKDNTSLKTFAPIDASKNFDKAKVLQKGNSEGVIDFGAVTFDSVLEAPTAAFKGDNAILATLVFRPQVAGTTNVNFNFTPGSTTDSNIVIATNPPVDTLETVTNLSLQVIGGPTATPGPSVSPTSTPPPISSPSPTGVVDSDVSYIRFAVRLFGAEKTPEIKVRLKVTDLASQLTPGPSPSDSCQEPGYGQYFYKDIPMVADNSGVYHPKEGGSFTYKASQLSITSDGWVPLKEANPGRIYSLSVKGQKYRNVEMVKNFTLNSGKLTSQDFDWTNKSLEPGDLPNPNDGGKQDCIVNSIDLSLIIDRIGAVEESALAIADVNYDGVVNGNDVSKVVATLSTKPDDD